VPVRRVDPARPRGALYRAWAWLAATRPMLFVSRLVVWRLDPPLLRLTGGRLGFGLSLPTGVLETRGARTGQPRRNALVYFHDGDAVVVVASKGGAPDNPAWFHNARANPDVRFGHESFTAEEVTDPAEQARLWTLADRVFPPYATYRRRAARSGREIPLLRLTPRRT
jgi:deazaflavin-dependent oxidoreductase (nitroreductase family)